MNILIADDDIDMVTILKLYYEKEGFTVFTALDGEEALELAYQHSIDLAVLDWMMPKLSGIEVCRELKQRAVKVLILTAKSEDEDELRALEMGADEYIRKPFEARILLMRSKKLLKAEDTISFGSLRVDTTGGKIYEDGRDVGVTSKEFELMKCLLDHKGKILNRKTLLDRVWGYDYIGEERTVDTHIRRLREKIGEDWIKTHRGMGYSLEMKHE
ncbi:DNA-binding response OmpR family regulator [Paenibacillus shirakamiensis]|uniref:DNA-binding response OmpR family regulator n=1 Tax=Paenibacillus shirakamiensis TaxID=1265935 RepID=A0ABS4JK21_9BACL|nr:DNA-binding response OmpR family regulator [Paenibacillus shirakamiensis]